MRILDACVLTSLVLAVSSCSGSDASNGGGQDSAASSDGGGDVSLDGNADAPSDTKSDVSGDAPTDGPDGATSDDGPFATQRASCAFKAGDKPGATFGPSIATMGIPIDTIVIVSQENHLFDNYFADLAAVGVTDADVAAKDAKLVDSAGTMVARGHIATACSGGYDPH